MCKILPMVFITALIVTGCTEKGSQPDTTPVMIQPALPEKDTPEPEEPKRVWRTVKRVIDGGTIELEGGEKVRLIGVDAPESSDCRVHVEYFGQEATAYTHKMVGGKKVRLEYGLTRKDKDGLTFAYVHCIITRSFLISPPGTPPDVDKVIQLEEIVVLNKLIIKQGYGRVDTEYPFKYLHEYQRLEREARDAKSGLWAQEKEEPTPSAALTTPRRVIPAELLDPLVVYITKSGKKYHLGSCSYLKTSKKPISPEEAKKQGYTPCSRCKPPE